MIDITLSNELWKLQTNNNECMKVDIFLASYFVMNAEKQAIFDRKTNNCCESISKGCTMIGEFYKIKKIYN